MLITKFGWRLFHIEGLMETSHVQVSCLSSDFKRFLFLILNFALLKTLNSFFETYYVVSLGHHFLGVIISILKYTKMLILLQSSMASFTRS